MPRITWTVDNDRKLLLQTMAPTKDLPLDFIASTFPGATTVAIAKRITKLHQERSATIADFPKVTSSPSKKKRAVQPSPTAASESSPSPTNSTFAATARAAIERANAARAPATARAPAKSKIGMKKQDNSKIALKPVREKIVKLNDPPKGKRKRGAAVIEPPQADADADTHEDKKTKVDDEGSSGKDDSDEGSSGKDDSDEDA